jgi:hypothetical protein
VARRRFFASPECHNVSRSVSLTSAGWAVLVPSHKQFFDSKPSSARRLLRDCCIAHRGRPVPASARASAARAAHKYTFSLCQQARLWPESHCLIFAVVDTGVQSAKYFACNRA